MLNLMYFCSYVQKLIHATFSSPLYKKEQTHRSAPMLALSKLRFHFSLLTKPVNRNPHGTTFVGATCD